MLQPLEIFFTTGSKIGICWESVILSPMQCRIFNPMSKIVQDEMRLDAYVTYGWTIILVVKIDSFHMHIKLMHMQWCAIENLKSPVYVVNCHFSRHLDRC